MPANYKNVCLEPKTLQRSLTIYHVYDLEIVTEVFFQSQRRFSCKNLQKTCWNAALLL